MFLTVIRAARERASHSEYHDLSGADLQYGSLSRHHLRKTDLRNANLTGADLTGARLESATPDLAVYPNEARRPSSARAMGPPGPEAG